MPGDTRIGRDSSGWFDKDNPTPRYRVRRQVRDARRNGHAQLNTVTAHAQALSSAQPAQRVQVPNPVIQNVTVVGTTGSGVHVFQGLQKRLFDRLTLEQGVSATEAVEVVQNNGYNKAASYGHMRAAGATHEEALDVIGLNDPDVSVAYGLNRYAGFNHKDALEDAVDNT